MTTSSETAVKGAARTRERILEAALDAFSASGFDGVSNRAIERRAGVERGLVAYHFTSKQGLWEAVVDAMFQRFFDEMGALRTALRDVSREERAKALLTAYARFNAKQPEFFRILVLEGHVRSERSEYLAGLLWHGVDLFRDFTDLTGPVKASEAVEIFQVIGSAGALYASSAYFDEATAEEMLAPSTIDSFAQAVARRTLAR